MMADRIRVWRTGGVNGGGPLSASTGRVYAVPVEPAGFIEMEPWQDYVGIDGRDGVTVGDRVEEIDEERGTCVLHEWASNIVRRELAAHGLTLRIIGPTKASGAFARS